MKSKLEELSHNYRQLQSKFKALKAKCEGLDKETSMAVEAASMALTAMIEAEQAVLAEASGMSLEEFKAERGCPSCGADKSCGDEDCDEDFDDFDDGDSNK